MAFTFIKAQDGKIGNSIVEDDKMPLALEILEKAKEQQIKIYLPVDAVIADSFSNDANRDEVDINEIPEGWQGLDVGKRSKKIFNNVVINSKTIL